MFRSSHDSIIKEKLYQITQITFKAIFVNSSANIYMCLLYCMNWVLMDKLSYVIFIKSVMKPSKVNIVHNDKVSSLLWVLSSEWRD